MSLKRLEREISKFGSQQPCIYIGLQDDDNMYKLLWSITCGEGGCYAGKTLRCCVTVATDYPFKPPKVSILDTMCHPNVSGNGQIYHEYMQTWEVKSTIHGALMAIRDTIMSPNTCCILNYDAYDMFVEDRQAYIEETCAEETEDEEGVGAEATEIADAVEHYQLYLTEACTDMTIHDAQLLLTAFILNGKSAGPTVAWLEHVCPELHHTPDKRKALADALQKI